MSLQPADAFNAQALNAQTLAQLIQRKARRRERKMGVAWSNLQDPAYTIRGFTDAQVRRMRLYLQRRECPQNFTPRAILRRGGRFRTHCTRNADGIAFSKLKAKNVGDTRVRMLKSDRLQEDQRVRALKARPCKDPDTQIRQLINRNGVVGTKCVPRNQPSYIEPVPGPAVLAPPDGMFQPIAYGTKFVTSPVSQLGSLPSRTNGFFS